MITMPTPDKATIRTCYASHTREHKYLFVITNMLTNTVNYEVLPDPSADPEPFTTLEAAIKRYNAI